MKAPLRLIVWALFFSSISTHAQEAVPIRLEATRRVLDNGLQIIAHPDHRAPVAAFQLWVRAGSVYEGERLGAGVSHFVEHMAFRERPGEEERVAARVQKLGGEVNAYTSFDHTVYHLKIPARYWEEGLACLRRLALEVKFGEKDTALEKDVILKEIHMGEDDPDRRLSRLLWSTAFQEHPYRHPIIGYRELVGALTPSDLEAYYHRRYVPNNMFLVATGDFEAEALFKAAAGLFTDPRGPYPELTVAAEPPQVVSREASEEMGTSLARMALAFHIPSILHPDLYALDVLAILAGQGRSSRLVHRVQEDKQLVYSINATSATLSTAGLFQVVAVVEPGKVAAVRAAVLEVLESFKAGVSAEELAKARRQVTADYLSALATVEGQARNLGYSVLLTGGTDFPGRYLEGIATVGEEDIKRAAEKYFRPENLVAVSLMPLSPPSTPEPQETSQPEEIKRVLDNGLTVIVKPDHTLPLAWIRLVFRGGVLGEDEQNNGIFHLLSQLLLKGTENRSAAEIAAKVEESGGGISVYSGRNSFGVSLDILSGQIESALEILGDLAGGSVFPVDEIEKERARMLAQIRAEKDQPRGLAGRLLLETFFAGHPYRFSPLGDESSVKKISRDELLAFYREYCVASNAVLAVFGDVDPEKLLPLVERRLGGLARGSPRSLEGKFPPPPPSARERVETRKGIEQAVVFLGFPGADLFGPERFVLEILTSYFSGLASPLFARARDQLGLAYYVGAYQILGLDPGACVFYAGTVPGQVDRLLEIAWEEIERVRLKGLSEEELQSNRDQLLGRHLFSVQDYGQLALISALDELYGLGYDAWRRYELNLRAVTNRDIQETARSLFSPGNSALVIVRPEIEKEEK